MWSRIVVFGLGGVGVEVVLEVLLREGYRGRGWDVEGVLRGVGDLYLVVFWVNKVIFFEGVCISVLGLL